MSYTTTPPTPMKNVEYTCDICGRSKNLTTSQNPATVTPDGFVGSKDFPGVHWCKDCWDMYRHGDGLQPQALELIEYLIRIGREDYPFIPYYNIESVL